MTVNVSTATIANLMDKSHSSLNHQASPAPTAHVGHIPVPVAGHPAVPGAGHIPGPKTPPPPAPSRDSPLSPDPSICDTRAGDREDDDDESYSRSPSRTPPGGHTPSHDSEYDLCKFPGDDDEDDEVSGNTIVVLSSSTSSEEDARDEDYEPSPVKVRCAILISQFMFHQFHIFAE